MGIAVMWLYLGSCVKCLVYWHFATFFTKRPTKNLQQMIHLTWMKVFRIIPEFRILRLTFYRKSASKCWIGRIILGFLIYIQSVWKTIAHLNLKLWIFSGHTASFKILNFKSSGFWKFWTFTHVNIASLVSHKFSKARTKYVVCCCFNLDCYG